MNGNKEAHNKNRGGEMRKKTNPNQKSRNEIRIKSNGYFRCEIFEISITRTKRDE